MVGDPFFIAGDHSGTLTRCACTCTPSHLSDVEQGQHRQLKEEIMADVPFAELVRNPELILALDPGETTGYAVMREGHLVEAGQLITNPVETIDGYFRKLVAKYQFARVVYEQYRVYRWRAKQHTWNDLHTPRLIGALQLLCKQNKIPAVSQTAQIAKGFCTDDKLRVWGFYQSGKPHRNDAVRHACYWVIFGKGTINERQTGRS